MATKTVYVVESNLLAELAGIGRFSMIDNLKKLELSITKAGGKPFRRKEFSSKSGKAATQILISKEEFPYVYAALSTKCRDNILAKAAELKWITTFEQTDEKQPSAKELCYQLMLQFNALEEKNRALLARKQTLEEEAHQVSQSDLELLSKIKEAFKISEGEKQYDLKKYLKAAVLEVARATNTAYDRVYTRLYDIYDSIKGTRCRQRAENAGYGTEKKSYLEWFKDNDLLPELVAILEIQYKEYLPKKDNFII